MDGLLVDVDMNVTDNPGEIDVLGCVAFDIDCESVFNVDELQSALFSGEAARADILTL